MPPIALVIGAAVAIATIGTAILHISSSESNSSSITDIPEKSNDKLKDQVEFFLLKKLLNGIVTIESKIFSSEANEKQEQQERIESISSTLGSKATSIAMNAAQDIIEQLNDANIFDSVAETIASGVNDVTADYEDAAASFQAEQRNGTWIETVPAYEQEPWTETYPAPENTEPQIESFPATQDEAPTITVFPHAKPEIPSIETIPAETPKELGDNILWNSGNKGAGNAIDPSKLSDVWKLGATERGDVIEEVLASTEYKDWYNIGSSQGGYFPVIDFQKGNNVVSLKTIDPTLSSMGGSGATNKVIDYINYLDKDITVNGNLANKILDVRIPEGTKSNFDITRIQEAADELGIKIIIKEFK